MNNKRQSFDGVDLLLLTLGINKVKFDSVGCCFLFERSTEVLRDVTFTVEAGQTVALVCFLLHICILAVYKVILDGSLFQIECNVPGSGCKLLFA